jgi:lysophospholipase L1-like esterase
MLTPRPCLLLLALLLTPLSLPAAEKKNAPAAAAGQPALPASDEGAPGQGPIRRDEAFQRRWRERHSAWAGRAAQDRQAVVFVGDATVDRWGAGLESAFRGIKVANRGIEGDTTRGVLLRLSPDVLALQPRAVVLLVGSTTSNSVRRRRSPLATSG